MRNRQIYNAIRIPAVGLLVLSIFLVLAIIPAGVSSPGIAHRSEDQVLVAPPPATVEAEHGSLSWLHVDAPWPYLRTDAAESFNALRKAIIVGAGFDFLAKCGDLFRAGNGRPAKVGTAFKSRHKSGQAFDYNQEDPRVLLVREYGKGHLHWRTYLLCERQNGTLGIKADLHTDNAGFVSAYVFDFTAAAEHFGWERIPAQPGWINEPLKKEFWHYQIGRVATNEAQTSQVGKANPVPASTSKATHQQINISPHQPHRLGRRTLETVSKLGWQRYGRCVDTQSQNRER